MGEVNLLYSAKTEQNINDWAKKMHNFSKSIKIEEDGKKILAVFGDIGSGTTRLVLYLYAFEKQEWRLLLVRITNTSDISIDIDKKEKKLIFRSKAGKLLLVQPLETIDLKFNQKEQ